MLGFSSHVELALVVSIISALAAFFIAWGQHKRAIADLENKFSELNKIVMDHTRNHVSFQYLGDMLAPLKENIIDIRGKIDAIIDRELKRGSAE